MSDDVEVSGFPIDEARRRFAELIRRVEAGEEIVIARGGRPAVRWLPAAPRVPGAWKAKIRMSDDFDAPLDDLFGEAIP